MHPTTIIEIIQLMINLFGLGLSLHHFIGTLAIHRYVQIAGIGNGRRVIAAGHVRSESLRLGMQAMLMITALISFVLLPAPSEAMPSILTQWILWRKFTIGLLSILLIAQTLGDASDRKILDEIESR